jgi:hypothetical protein
MLTLYSKSYMKKGVLYLLAIINLNLYGQTHEVGGGMGFAYYFGDLNIVNHNRHPFTFITESFNPKNYKMAYSLSYRYNFLNQFSLGAYFNHLYLSGYDSDNKSKEIYDAEWSRLVRNLSFHTAVNSLTVDVRYEYFRTEDVWGSSYNSEYNNWIISPYAGAGIGLFSFNPKTWYQGEEIELQPLGTEGQGIKPYGQKYSLTGLILPFSVGIRFIEPNRVYSVGIDFTYTYTFTDYLDDVSSKSYIDPAVFRANYDPAKAALVTALANRNPESRYPGSTGGPADIRGNPSQSDAYLSGQIRFTVFLDALQDKYWRFK